MQKKNSKSQNKTTKLQPKRLKFGYNICDDTPSSLSSENEDIKYDDWDDREKCLVCGEFDKMEDRIQCIIYKMWAHAECSGFENGSTLKEMTEKDTIVNTTSRQFDIPEATHWGKHSSQWRWIQKHVQ